MSSKHFLHEYFITLSFNVVSGNDTTVLIINDELTGRYRVVDSLLIIYNENIDDFLEGWYYKINQTEYLPLPIKLLTSEDSFRLNMFQEHYFDFVKKNNELDNYNYYLRFIENIHAYPLGLHKINNKNLIKLSDDLDDFYKLDNGFYFISFPGTGVCKIINLNELARSNL